MMNVPILPFTRRLEDLLNLCVDVCVGRRAADGTCQDLGLGLGLGIGIGGIHL